MTDSNADFYMCMPGLPLKRLEDEIIYILAKLSGKKSPDSLLSKPEYGTRIELDKILDSFPALCPNKKELLENLCRDYENIRNIEILRLMDARSHFKHSGGLPAEFHNAFNCLAKDGKIILEKQDGKVYVYLPDKEQQIARYKELNEKPINTGS